MRIILGGWYRNEHNQRLQVLSVDYSAGRINARALVHNFTTGQKESWSVRLFLAEHSREK